MDKAGLAKVYRGSLVMEFDNDPYWKEEQEALEAGRGMWSLGDRYLSSREWRRRGN